MTNHPCVKLLDGRFWAVFIFILVLFLLLLSSIDLAAQEPSLPLSPPNAANGLAVFANRCANCHGATGGGDGELSGQLLVAPAHLNNPAFRETAVPGNMFDTISSGIMESGMPPFGPASSNPLDEASRWDLVAAVYSFSTPPDSIAMGQAVYEENCLACHGEMGLGDGPDAASEAAGLDLTRLDYWFSRSNDAVLADLSGDAIAEHAYELSEAELVAVVDYGRTFSYEYAPPPEPPAAIEGAVITGQINNGTTGDVVGGGEARLRAFTVSFEETLNLTTTVGGDGRFQFELPEVQPDWVFLTGYRYNDLTFSSDAGQISDANLPLDLPITVYETTSDSSVISYEQVHLIMEFQSADLLQVSELYVISNGGTAVFVGESGSPDQGTIHFSLPDGAQNPVFERTLGSIDSTIPATEVIQTDNGWADTLPLQPGTGGINLIVSYMLPYSDGMTFSHPLPYAANRATIILPDAGVDVTGSEWEFQGSNQMGEISFLSYVRGSLTAGSNLALTLEGEPEGTRNLGGSTVAPRNSTNELLIGGGILLIVIAAAVFVYRNWQTAPSYTDDYVYDDDEYEYEDEVEEEDEATRLLQAIADLDDAYEKGDLDEADYNSQREQLKSELKTLWK